MSVARKTRCLVHGIPTDVEVSDFERNQDDVMHTLGHRGQLCTKTLEVDERREQRANLNVRALHEVNDEVLQ